MPPRNAGKSGLISTISTRKSLWGRSRTARYCKPDLNAWISKDAWISKEMAAIFNDCFFAFQDMPKNISCLLNCAFLGWGGETVKTWEEDRLSIILNSVLETRFSMNNFAKFGRFPALSVLEITSREIWERRTWFEKRPVSREAFSRKLLQLSTTLMEFIPTSPLKLLTKLSQADSLQIELCEETRNHFRQKCNFSPSSMSS